MLTYLQQLWFLLSLNYRAASLPALFCHLCLERPVLFSTPSAEDVNNKRLQLIVNAKDCWAPGRAMARSMVVSEQKLGEKLSILHHRGVGMLTR